MSTLKQLVAESAAAKMAAAVLVGDDDQVLMPIMGISGKPSHLAIRVDSNVFYHLHCTDRDTITAFNALRTSDQAQEWAPFEVTSAYQIEFEPESETLQVTAIRTLDEMTAAIWRLAMAAVAIQAMAFALTGWQPR